MGTYAKRTVVPVERSRAEVERIMARFGARRTMIYQDDETVVLAFDAGARRFKIAFPKPRQDAYVGVRAFQQAERERWREVVAYLKAVLIAVEAGFVTLETAFLAHIMLPDGSTMGDWSRAQLDDINESGRMPPLLPWTGDSGQGQVLQLPPPRREGSNDE